MMDQVPFGQPVLTPSSGGSTIYASPDPNQHQLSHTRSSANGNGASNGYSSPVKTELDDDHGGSNASATSPGDPEKKKRKRNKPTLSCFECVERKTKASPPDEFFVS